MSDLWKQSICKGGLLHNYRIEQGLPDGVIEICAHCHDKKYFRNNEPSRLYLDHHLRQALQRDHQRFNREYRQ